MKSAGYIDMMKETTPSNPASGWVRFYADSSTGVLKALTSAGGDGFAAVTLPSFADNETPSGTINGSNAAFTLAHAPSPTASLILCLNGAVQLQGTDYTLSSTTITFTNAPSTNATLLAFYRY